MANVRAEKAVEFLHGGCNCAQAVLNAFADKHGKTEEEVKAWAAGFGSGMGSMEGTCGAFCGAVMVVGLLQKDNMASKKIAREMNAEFKEKVGATICGDIKGIKTKKMFCSCDDCVRHAVVALEKHL
ncbi:MAG: C-GCAxxG-C-C family protein [Selenomonadaceae bacterium]|nr:C-GCAxxG-C-C family protein [Selenomonadaceae bacterium]